MARAMYPKCTMPAVITEEMHYVAQRENLPPELIRGVAGSNDYPRINHTNLEPMCIGIASKCKVNANIGASPNSSHLDEEVKLNLAVKYGADTVMDLSTGGATWMKSAPPSSTPPQCRLGRCQCTKP